MTESERWVGSFSSPPSTPECELGVFPGRWQVEDGKSSRPGYPFPSEIAHRFACTFESEVRVRLYLSNNLGDIHNPDKRRSPNHLSKKHPSR